MGWGGGLDQWVPCVSVVDLCCVYVWCVAGGLLVMFSSGEMVWGLVCVVVLICIDCLIW